MTLSPASSRGESPPIAIADLAGFPNDPAKALLGDGSWGSVASGQKELVVGYAGQNANAVWLVANAAILVPFTIYTSQTVSSLVVTAGGAQSGNFDIGVYSAAGTRQVSKGSTAQSTLTASTVQTVTVGVTVIVAGEYYLALAADNIVGSFAFAGIACAALRAQRLVSAAFPLPASLTVGTTRPSNALQLMAELT